MNILILAVSLAAFNVSQKANADALIPYQCALPSVALYAADWCQTGRLFSAVTKSDEQRPQLAPSPQAEPETAHGAKQTRWVASGAKTRIYLAPDMDDDCKPTGDDPVIKAIEEPEHGTLTFEQTEYHVGYPANHARFKCNKQLTKGMAIFYQSKKGFAGRDSAKVIFLFPSGAAFDSEFVINVK